MKKELMKLQQTRSSNKKKPKAKRTKAKGHEGRD